MMMMTLMIMIELCGYVRTTRGCSDIHPTGNFQHVMNRAEPMECLHTIVNPPTIDIVISINFDVVM